MKNLILKRFTLMEMMVVVAIIVLVLGMILPAFTPMFVSSALKGKTAEIKILLMEARSLAATHQESRIITFNFDSIGDMNGDGFAGVKDEDDDEDGIIDEDIQLCTIDMIKAIESSTLSYNITPKYIEWEPDVSFKDEKYIRGIVPTINSNETKDGVDNNVNGYIDENAYILEYSGNDDEDDMTDEGDSVFIERLGDADLDNKLYPVDTNANISNESDYSRALETEAKQLKQSEEIFTGNSVIISRIWSGDNLVLIREALVGKGQEADKSICHYNVVMDKLDMKTWSGHRLGKGDSDYCFSAFYFLSDGWLYYDDDGNQKNDRDLTIELRNRASTDRRLIVVKSNGLIQIDK